MTIYYVSLSGNDLWNGLYSTYQGATNGPFRHIYYATGQSTLNPGDVIYILSGTYQNDAISPAGAVSGTSSLPITVQAYPGDIVTIQQSTTYYDPNQTNTPSVISPIGQVLLSITATGGNYTLSLGNASPSYNNPGGEGNRTSLITVTDSGLIVTQGGAVDSRLVNGDANTKNLYFNSTSASGNWIQFNFGSSKLITEFIFYQESTQPQGTWVVQGSSNGSSWTTISDSFILGASTPDIHEVSMSGIYNATSYQYYRLYGISGSTNYGPWVYQFNFNISGVVETTGSISHSAGSGTIQTAISSLSGYSSVQVTQSTNGYKINSLGANAYVTVNTGGLSGGTAMLTNIQWLGTWSGPDEYGVYSIPYHYFNGVNKLTVYEVLAGYINGTQITGAGANFFGGEKLNLYILEDMRNPPLTTHGWALQYSDNGFRYALSYLNNEAYPLSIQVTCSDGSITAAALASGATTSGYSVGDQILVGSWTSVPNTAFGVGYDGSSWGIVKVTSVDSTANGNITSLSVVQEGTGYVSGTYLSNPLITLYLKPPANENVFLTVYASAGTFSLTWNSSTKTFNWYDNAATIQSALNSISEGSGITVTDCFIISGWLPPNGSEGEYNTVPTITSGGASITKFTGSPNPVTGNLEIIGSNTYVVLAVTATSGTYTLNWSGTYTNRYTFNWNDNAQTIQSAIRSFLDNQGNNSFDNLIVSSCHTITGLGEWGSLSVNASSLIGTIRVEGDYLTAFHAPIGTGNLLSYSSTGIPEERIHDGPGWTTNWQLQDLETNLYLSSPDFDSGIGSYWTVKDIQFRNAGGHAIDVPNTTGSVVTNCDFQNSMFPIGSATGQQFTFSYNYMNCIGPQTIAVTFPGGDNQNNSIPPAFTLYCTGSTQATIKIRHLNLNSYGIPQNIEISIVENSNTTVYYLLCQSGNTTMSELISAINSISSGSNTYTATIAASYVGSILSTAAGLPINPNMAATTSTDVYYLADTISIFYNVSGGVSAGSPLSIPDNPSDPITMGWIYGIDYISNMFSWVHGIYWEGNTPDNSLVHDNYFGDVSCQQMSWRTGSGDKIYNNIFNNTWGYGPDIAGTNDSFYNNIVATQSRPESTIWQGPTNQHWSFIISSPAAQVYNNTAIGDAFLPGLSGSIVKNNILYQKTYLNGKVVSDGDFPGYFFQIGDFTEVIDYNVWYIVQQDEAVTYATPNASNSATTPSIGMLTPCATAMSLAGNPDSRNDVGNVRPPPAGTYYGWGNAAYFAWYPIIDSSFMPGYGGNYTSYPTSTLSSFDGNAGWFDYLRNFADWAILNVTATSGTYSITYRSATTTLAYNASASAVQAVFPGSSVSTNSTFANIYKIIGIDSPNAVALNTTSLVGGTATFGWEQHSVARMDPQLDATFLPLSTSPALSTTQQTTNFTDYFDHAWTYGPMGDVAYGAANGCGPLVNDFGLVGCGANFGFITNGRTATFTHGDIHNIARAIRFILRDGDTATLSLMGTNYAIGANGNQPIFNVGVTNQVLSSYGIVLEFNNSGTDYQLSYIASAANAYTFYVTMVSTLCLPVEYTYTFSPSDFSTIAYPIMVTSITGSGSLSLSGTPVANNQVISYNAISGGLLTSTSPGGSPYYINFQILDGISSLTYALTIFSQATGTSTGITTSNFIGRSIDNAIFTGSCIAAANGHNSSLVNSLGTVDGLVVGGGVGHSIDNAIGIAATGATCSFLGSYTQSGESGVGTIICKSTCLIVGNSIDKAVASSSGVAVPSATTVTKSTAAAGATGQATCSSTGVTACLGVAICQIIESEHFASASENRSVAVSVGSTIVSFVGQSFDLSIGQVLGTTTTNVVGWYALQIENDDSFYINLGMGETLTLNFVLSEGQFGSIILSNVAVAVLINNGSPMIVIGSTTQPISQFAVISITASDTTYILDYASQSGDTYTFILSIQSETSFASAGAAEGSPLEPSTITGNQLNLFSNNVTTSSDTNALPCGCNQYQGLTCPTVFLQSFTVQGDTTASAILPTVTICQQPDVQKFLANNI